MLLWIEMNVMNQVDKVFIGRDKNSFERSLKQVARASVCQIDGFAVGIEKVRELLGRVEVFDETCQVLQNLTGLFIANSYEQMKMISQQAVRVRFGNRLDVFGVQV